MIQSIRLSHVEPLELCELAHFCCQRRELVVADLNARDTSQTKIDEPRVPHVEHPEIAQQTELGRKRLELVVEDLKTWLSVRSRSNSFNNRTESTSSVARCAISLGSEQSLLMPSHSSFKFFMRNNSDGTSVRPILIS
jgi:hypothetical protein